MGQSKFDFGNVSYKEAYSAIIELYNKAYDDVTFSLVYFDDDDTPELACGKTGYYVSMYTFKDGVVYTLMDRWGYGAGGNYGYEYLPGENVLLSLNSDMGGAIHTIYYAKMNEDNEIEDIYFLREETDDLGVNTKYYIDDEEITEYDYEDYILEGDFFMIRGEYSRSEMEVFLK